MSGWDDSSVYTYEDVDTIDTHMQNSFISLNGLLSEETFNVDSSVSCKNMIALVGISTRNNFQVLEDYVEDESLHFEASFGCKTCCLNGIYHSTAAKESTFDKVCS